MQYLIWFDDNPKKPISTKVQEAIAAYRAKLGKEPNQLLVNGPVDLHIDGVTIQTRPQCGEHCIWVGQEEQTNGNND